MVEQNQLDPKDPLAQARAVRLKSAGKTRPTVTVKDKRHGHTYELAAEDFDPAIHEKVAAAPAPAAEAEAPADDGGAEEGQEGAESGDGGGEDKPAIPDNFDELNAGEAIGLIKDTEDLEVVRAIEHYEAEHGKRKTVLHAAAARAEKLEEPAEEGTE